MNDINQKLERKFGPKKIKYDEASLNEFGQDWYKGISPNAQAIFFPENTKDVQDILNFAKDHNLKLLPSGGRTGLSGGATAVCKEIVVNMKNLNEISWVADDLLKCQAGVVTDNAKNIASEKKRILPIEFSATSSSMIGGNVATNAAGAKFIGYGATRNHVQNMTVVLPGGEIVELGKTADKDATGPNLMELFIGSEGIFGFIIDVTFKTYPIPKFSESVILHTNNLFEVYELLKEPSKMITAVEFLDFNSQHLLDGNAKSKYEILIELNSDSKDEIENFLEHCSERMENTSLLNSRQVKNFWDRRELLPVKLSEMGAEKFDFCIDKLSTEKFMAEIDRKISHAKVFNFGHLGDGNIHLNIIFDDNSKDQLTEVYDILKSFGGSPSAEHGIGKRKKEIWNEFPQYKQKLELLKTLKKSIDPEGIIAPKVFFD